MKIPRKPPILTWNDVLPRMSHFAGLDSSIRRPTIDGRYMHWDKLRRLPNTMPITLEERWWLIRQSRDAVSKPVPLKDESGRHFQYCLPDPAGELLHGLDKDAAGQILISDEVTNPGTRDRYVISSLMEEAITSSQLEGAATTRVIAKAMLRTGRAPRDRSEQMIVNNFRVMRKIQSLRDQSLTPETIIELQRILTDNAIDDPTGVGRLRRQDETVRVEDNDGQILHMPPKADGLETRMQRMCDFANDVDKGPFVHPVVRAIILHFWLAYDHPFVDGNGRCARALFYWSMLRSGYWLCEFISISQFIRKAPIKYGRTFLYVETDSNDLTYFIFYHLHLIRQAIDEMRSYLRRKIAETRDLQRVLRGSQHYNHRQLALLSHAVQNPDAVYTIASHQTSHNVVYETARTDLLELEKLNLIESRKIGKTYTFTPAREIEERMKSLN